MCMFYYFTRVKMLGAFSDQDLEFLVCLVKITPLRAYINDDVVPGQNLPFNHS